MVAFLCRSLSCPNAGAEELPVWTYLSACAYVGRFPPPGVRWRPALALGPAVSLPIAHSLWCAAPCAVLQTRGQKASGWQRGSLTRPAPHWSQRCPSATRTCMGRRSVWAVGAPALPLHAPARAPAHANPRRLVGGHTLQRCGQLSYTALEQRSIPWGRGQGRAATSASTRPSAAPAH